MIRKTTCTVITLLGLLSSQAYSQVLGNISSSNVASMSSPNVACTIVTPRSIPFVLMFLFESVEGNSDTFSEIRLLDNPDLLFRDDDWIDSNSLNEQERESLFREILRIPNLRTDSANIVYVDDPNELNTAARFCAYGFTKNASRTNVNVQINDVSARVLELCTSSSTNLIGAARDAVLRYCGLNSARTAPRFQQDWTSN